MSSGSQAGTLRPSRMAMSVRTTSCPAASSREHRSMPSIPLAPVTRTRMACLLSLKREERLSRLIIAEQQHHGDKPERDGYLQRAVFEQNLVGRAAPALLVDQIKITAYAKDDERNGEPQMRMQPGCIGFDAVDRVADDGDG